MPNYGVTLNSVPCNVAVCNAKVNIGESPTSYAFGVLAVGAAPSTGLDYFTITNNSGFAIDVSIHGTDMSGGIGWTLADDGNVGVDIFAMKAGLEGGAYDIIIKKNTPYNLLVQDMPTNSSQKWGIKFYAPTGFSDGVAKSGTVTVSGYAA